MVDASHLLAFPSVALGLLIFLFYPAPVREHLKFRKLVLPWVSIYFVAVTEPWALLLKENFLVFAYSYGILIIFYIPQLLLVLSMQLSWLVG